jgi:acyl carrier protein
MSIRDKLTEFLAIVTDCEPEDVPADASMETFPAWDSLAQINLCLMIQETFGFELELKDISENTALDKLTALIAARAPSQAA